jgi:hypothetical protein
MEAVKFLAPASQRGYIEDRLYQQSQQELYVSSV